MSRRVAVLHGGRSAEREVSLVSGRAVADALRGLGDAVLEIDVGSDFLDRLPALRGEVDVVFNALHGRWGEDGCVQGALELAGIPYTHSGVLASALAMDKPMARRLFAGAGIPVPEGAVFDRDEILGGDPMKRPYVVKPLAEGSSVGVRVVRDGTDFAPLGDGSWPYGDRVLVERYVPGREITVAVMGDRALAALEIQPVGGFYDYDAKYVAGRSRHLVPAPMPPGDYAEALRLARLAHDTLGCRGVSRADFRWDDVEGSGLFLLEVNTQPGMTPMSLVPEIAAHAGIAFPALVDWMVQEALCRS